ncbi:MAG: dihydroorotate dehydrogenase (quinone) [Cyanobacteria bacterium QS_8_64_29]|nr:MAG: dihydroorotate dehydrogenase (quinone) [Cyanobacteria bacterium QS_8_64_29]
MDPYRSAIAPLLFSGLRADPEWLHRQSLRQLHRLAAAAECPPASWIHSQLERTFRVDDGRLAQTLWGLRFPNPIGLAAGLDKDGVAAGLWGALGFGFAELGTVTQHPQPGNPRPRLFRLPRDRAALNRMGFPNHGSAALRQQLQSQQRAPYLPWGINLGKSRATPLAEAAADYAASFRALREVGDYFVVNVSSPNTPELRSLQAADRLGAILKALQAENQRQKPLLVKLAPDADWDAMRQAVDLARSYDLAGFVATNTTTRRDGLRTQTLPGTSNLLTAEPGGISGAPLRDRATETIRFLWHQTRGELPIIGVGGVFSAEDAWAKISAGASLVQVYTGWIYEGPWQLPRISTGLLGKLDANGYATIPQAVGNEPSLCSYG